GDIPTIEPAGSPGAAPESPVLESPVLESPGIEPSGEASEPPASPGAEVASPVLDAFLPKNIGGTPFVVQTYTGTDVFGDDAGSRAVSAGLRELGKTPADVELAEAYDQDQAMDLYLFAFRLPNVDPEALRSLVLDSWLVAGAEGVTTEQVELG